jgi:hypothetical protein
MPQKISWRVGMKYIRYLMALVVLLVMVGWASATLNLITMGGGANSNTGGTGSTTGYANSFVTDPATALGEDEWIQADILAVASAAGTGTASITTTVPTYVTQSLSGDNFALTVGASGTTEASVKGNDAAAAVTSVGRIHAHAEASGLTFTTPDVNDPDDVQVDANNVWGDAWISSAIGHDWTSSDPGAPWFQLGFIEGKPQGMFYADASANGKATYAANIGTPTSPPAEVLAQPPAGYQYGLIDGSVEGATTLEGQVADDRAEIKGTVPSIDMYQITHWFPGGADQALGDYTSLVNDASSVSSKLSIPDGMGTNDNIPAIAAIAAGSYADSDPFAAAGVANIVAVGAENDGIPQDALTYAAGTVAGKASSDAKVQYYEGDSLNERKVKANKEDAMSADVRVQKPLDGASALALLATGAVSAPDFVVSGAIADTFGGVKRTSATGSQAADGSDRAWGESFISSGTWSAWGAALDSGTLLTQADVSGGLKQEGPEVGMGSGAFLQSNKLNPAYANMLLVQGAEGDVYDAGKFTFQVVGADVMGPKAHSLGSGKWDGSGVSSDLTNLYVHIIDTNVPAHSFEPVEISTKIDSVKAYLWTDGTNDLQYNGLAFTPSTPMFDPAGVGQFTGLLEAYLPSPTQRETIVGIATTQPSII